MSVKEGRSRLLGIDPDAVDPVFLLAQLPDMPEGFAFFSFGLETEEGALSEFFKQAVFAFLGGE